MTEVGSVWCAVVQKWLLPQLGNQWRTAEALGHHQLAWLIIHCEVLPAKTNKGCMSKKTTLLRRRKPCLAIINTRRRHMTFTYEYKLIYWPRKQWHIHLIEQAASNSLSFLTTSWKITAPQIKFFFFIYLFMKFNTVITENRLFKPLHFTNKMNSICKQYFLLNIMLLLKCAHH